MAILRSPVTAFDLDLPPTASEAIVNVMHAALAAVDPADALSRAVELRDSHPRVGTCSYDLGSRERIYVAGAGKASAPMAVALEELLGERITAGWVNVKDGYTAPTRIISMHEAGHPVPDARGVEGSPTHCGSAVPSGPEGPRVLSHIWRRVCPHDFAGGRHHSQRHRTAHAGPAAQRRNDQQDQRCSQAPLSFFEALGDLLVTGPTNTNVNDLILVFGF